VLVLLVTTIRLSTTILFYLGNGQDRTIIIKPNVHVELLFLQLTASITTKSQTTFAILPHTCISQQTSPRFPQQTSPTRHTANLAPHACISQQTSPCTSQQTSSRHPAANIAPIYHSRPRLTHRIPQQISHCTPLVVEGAYGVGPSGGDVLVCLSVSCSYHVVDVAK